MSTKLGHFEILSELAKSPTSTVYKANDESGQTIALKAIQLSAFGENAAELEQALLAESEATKVLSSSNIANVTSASVIEGQFCAVMEYIQGNSIATMLARKEGFSIWDLLDIGRQLSSWAGAREIAQHCALQPGAFQDHVRLGWNGQDSELRRFQRRELCAARGRRNSLDAVLHVAGAGSRRGDRCAIESVQPGRHVL